MVRLREVRAWRERLGKGTSGGPVRVARDHARSERARRAARPASAHHARRRQGRRRQDDVRGCDRGSVCAPRRANAARLDRSGGRTRHCDRRAGRHRRDAGCRASDSLVARQLSAADAAARFSRRSGATRSPRSSIAARISIATTSTAGRRRAARRRRDLRAARARRLLADPTTRLRAHRRRHRADGHTLRLLALPETFRALLSMLDSMQEKHRFMVRALTHRYRARSRRRFLDDMRSRVDALRAVLADGASARRGRRHARRAGRRRRDAALRRRPARAARSRRRGRRRTLPTRRAIACRARRWIDAVDSALPRFRSSDAPAARRRANARGHRTRRASHAGATAARAIRRDRDVWHAATRRRTLDPRSLRTLTIVGGKGGVGKSTVALRARHRRRGRRRAPVLLVSTDPAPSIADALGEPDATGRAATSRTTLDRRARTRRAADGCGRGVRATARRVSVAHRRAVRRARRPRRRRRARPRDSARPPRARAAGRRRSVRALRRSATRSPSDDIARIVVDPAPTGHLLRLLEMPAIALDWTHRLMRLMLKYRDVVGLGDTARELLDFAKRTRALDALLARPRRDAASCSSRSTSRSCAPRPSGSPRRCASAASTSARSSGIASTHPSVPSSCDASPRASFAPTKCNRRRSASPALRAMVAIVARRCAPNS